MTIISHSAERGKSSKLTLVRVPEGDDTLLCKVNTPTSSAAIPPLPYFCQFDTCDVEDLSELKDLLGFLRSEPKMCVIRAEALDPEDDTPRRRLLNPDRKTGDAATLRSVARDWVLIDADSVPCPEGLDFPKEPERAAHHVRSLLPSVFHTAGCVWRASSGAGLKPGIRVHLWFRLTTELDTEQLNRWLGIYPVDHHVFGANHPHFTADPMFLDGAADPMSARIGMLEGTERVAVPAEITAVPAPTLQSESRSLTPLTGLDPFTARALRQWEADHPSTESGRFDCPACQSVGACAELPDGKWFCHANGHKDRAPTVGKPTRTPGGTGYVGLRFEFQTVTEWRDIRGRLEQLGYEIKRFDGKSRTSDDDASTPHEQADAVPESEFSADRTTLAVREIKRLAGAVKGDANALPLMAREAARWIGQVSEEFVRNELQNATLKSTVRMTFADAEKIVDEAITAGKARPRTYDAGAPQDEPALAELFASHFADQVAHVAGLGWYTFDGLRWIAGTKDAKPTRLLSTMLRTLASEHRDAGRDELADALDGMQTRRALDDIIALAAQGALRIESKQLDRDPYLLNCPNGTLDLRTGKLRAHDPNDYVTHVTVVPFNPKAPCGAWLALLDDYSHAAEQRSDAEWVNFVQLQLGNSLIGEALGEYIVFWEGTGGNGKSTVMNTVAGVLGTYAGLLPASAVTEAQAHTSSIGGLVGKRYIRSAEIDSKRPIAAARLKALVGYEGMRVQTGMAKDFVDFVPSGKLTLSINGVPRIIDADRAMKRRLRIVPFRAEFEANSEMVRIDKELLADDDESAGILAWLVRGAQAMLARNGVLPDCAAVTLATDAAFAENDPIADWFDACCERVGGVQTAFRALYASYRRCAVDSRETHVLSRKQFGGALTEHGFPAVKGGKGERVRVGLKLLVIEEAREHFRSFKPKSA